MTEQKNIVNVHYSINVTLFFILMSLIFITLIILNSASEWIHPIMLIVMIYGLISSYKKVYFSIDLETKKLTTMALLGPLKKEYSFDKIVIKKNKIYRSLAGVEKSIPSSNLFCNTTDYKNLREKIENNKT
ncbi:hypothetical protein DNU06_15840 [Putridiphycobacter roseus]|uniref:Uncharacterized protein n=1 Tax=Putridiphycobacter roseus TaxID=2219161 RepID=A0A2W1MZ52_9FLAO|nr:hypothetical protein [Putridiphycobacter roseus]PZE15851.1 hypothetical protein DNU06_15840 [Putridiphycobacter roseus]